MRFSPSPKWTRYQQLGLLGARNTAAMSPSTSTERERSPSCSGPRTDAGATLGADLLQQARPVDEAVELLRPQRSPDWLEHRASDRLRTPGDRASVFPATGGPVAAGGR